MSDRGTRAVVGRALDTELTLDQRESPDAVKLSAGYLPAVINGIPDLGKIEAGKFDRDPIAEQTVTSLVSCAHTRGLERIRHVTDEC